MLSPAKGSTTIQVRGLSAAWAGDHWRDRTAQDKDQCRYGTGAGMLSWAAFQPDSVMTGVLAPRSDEL